MLQWPGVVVENQRSRMTFGQIERPAGGQKPCHDLCPAPDVGQPVDGAPGHEHEVERAGLGDGCWRIVQIRLDEPRTLGQPQLRCQPSGSGDRGSGEIEADDPRPALRQDQSVAAKVALQMQDAAVRDPPELRFLDGIEPTPPGAQRIQLVALGSKVNGDPLVPIGSIGTPPVLIHAKSPAADPRG
jgi:hypothetical protein